MRPFCELTIFTLQTSTFQLQIAIFVKYKLNIYGMMKNTKQTLVLLLAVALTYGCGGGESVNEDVANGIEAYVNELEKGYRPMASTRTLSGRTWSSHKKGYMVEVFEDESFTDSFHIIRYKSIRPDTTVVGSYKKRYYLSLIRKPGRFDESKVGTYTEGDYIIEEMTYKGQKTYRSYKLLLVSPTELEMYAVCQPGTIIGGTDEQAIVREE